MHKRKIIRRALLISLLFAKMAYAQEPDPDQEALQKTQELMMDLNMRNYALAEDPDAKAVDNQVNELTKGSAALNQEIYSISAEVMADIVKQSGGDPAKMQQILDRAKGDPEGFLSSMNTHEKDRVRGVAGQIEIQNGTQRK